jgi:hypothetical protein
MLASTALAKVVAKAAVGQLAVMLAGGRMRGSTAKTMQLNPSFL